MINIYNQDCLEAMKLMKDNQFDLAIVDPPYGINIVSEFKKTINSSSSMMKGMNGIFGSEWDNATPTEEYFTNLKRVSKNQIIWGGNYFLDYLNSTRCFLSWDKMNGTNNMADFELAWTSFNKSCRRFSMHHFSKGYGKKIHPTQKPVKLYEWILINYAKEGDRILDTHLGSGSIALACHNLGYDLEGYELDKEYYDNALKRIKNHQAQLRLI